MTAKALSLGDICEFKYGKSLPAKSRDGGIYSVFGSNGKVGGHSESITDGKTIVIGRKGSIGELVWSDNCCWPIDTTYYIDQSAAKCDLRWLYHALSQLRLSEMNKSAAIPGLNRNDAYEKKLFVPEIEEQRRIAAILDKADALSQKRRQAIEKLDQLLQSVFLDMFGDPVTNPKGWDGRVLPELAEHFCDGPFGSNLKSSHYTEAGVQVIRLQNIAPWRLLQHDRAYISEEHFQTLSRNHCLPGDVLIGTLGDPNLRACILPPSVTAALNKADCLLFRPNRELVTAEYICGLLNCESLVANSSSLALGQTRLRISLGRLKGLKVPVPPIEKQKLFSQVVQKFGALEKSTRVNLTRLEVLFHSIQQRAFNGTL